MSDASIFPAACRDPARALLDSCVARGLRLATAESCTGGLIAACLTEFAGSSRVVDRGWITYDDRAKIELLGVRPETLAAEGAVSEATAREMAMGALARSGCALALAVTGIAGPGGATPAKPVGLVHVAVAAGGGAIRHERHLFPGDRQEVRLATVTTALNLALALLDERGPGS